MFFSKNELSYPLVNKHGWLENGPFEDVQPSLKNRDFHGIFRQAMLPPVSGTNNAGTDPYLRFFLLGVFFPYLRLR